MRYFAALCSTNDQPGGWENSATTCPSSRPITTPGVGNVTVAGGGGAASCDGPERVVVRRREHGERLHAPVRRAGRVVRLAHPAIVVAVADREHAVAVADRSCVLHHRRWRNARPRTVAQSRASTSARASAPQHAALRHPVRHAPAERERAAVGREPVLELGCEKIERARRSARRRARSPNPDAARTSP